MGGRVVVLGSVNVDLTATTAVLPRPGQTVVGSGLALSPGGKGANQAVAAARAGAEVLLCAAVGRDAFGDVSLEALAAEGVHTERVERVDGPTGVALILVEASGENEIVVVAGANGRAHGAGVDWRPGDVAAAVLEVPMGAVAPFLAAARAAGATTVLNAAPVTADAATVLALADVLCVNDGEWAALGGPRSGAVTVVSQGAEGLRVLDADGAYRVAGHTVEVVDTVGAGDALCGVLAAGLAAGLSLRPALERANAAAALTVRAPGARTSPSAVEIDMFVAAGR